MHAEPSSELRLRGRLGGAAVEPSPELAGLATVGAGSRAANATPATWSRFRYPQSLYKYVALLGSLAFLAFSIEYLNIDLERLPGLLGRMGEMLARRYVPPNVGHVYYTYEPLYPHEMLYPHHRTYHRYYDDGRGLTRACRAMRRHRPMPRRMTTRSGHRARSARPHHRSG